MGTIDSSDLFAAAPTGDRFVKRVEYAQDLSTDYGPPGGFALYGLVIGETAVYRRTVERFNGFGGPDSGWCKLTFRPSEVRHLVKENGWVADRVQGGRR